jgi:hypothetical protein
MKTPVAVVLIVLGLGLLLVSSLWPKLSSGKAYWGDEQQAQFAEALRHAHQLEGRASTGKRQTAADKEAHERELAAARENWEAQQAKLAEAKDANQRPATICFWAGVVALLGGVLAYRFL